VGASSTTPDAKSCSHPTDELPLSGMILAGIGIMPSSPQWPLANHPHLLRGCRANLRCRPKTPGFRGVSGFNSHIELLESQFRQHYVQTAFSSRLHGGSGRPLDLANEDGLPTDPQGSFPPVRHDDESLAD